MNICPNKTAGNSPDFVRGRLVPAALQHQIGGIGSANTWMQSTMEMDIKKIFFLYSYVRFVV